MTILEVVKSLWKTHCKHSWDMKHTFVDSALQQRMTLDVTQKLIFPGGTSSWKLTCQCRRYRRHKRCWFDPWVVKILLRKAWQPTPVFLPGESHGPRSLAAYSPWGHKVLDMTEATENTCKGKKREKWVFYSFPFFRTKEIKKTVSSLNIPSFFTLTAHNSECLWLFAFQPPNSAGATSNIFSLDSMLNTSAIWWLPLQHPSPCTYISETRLQSHPNCQSQLLGYWLQSKTVFEKLHEEEI